MAHDNDGGLGSIQRGAAQVHQRRIGHGRGILETDDLGDVGGFHDHMVQHAGVEGLGLEVQVAALLARMKRRNQMYQLTLRVFHGCPKVLQRFRLQPQDQPDVGGLHGHVAAQVDLEIFAVVFDQMVDDVPGVSAVGRKPRAAGLEHHPALLAGDIDAASAPPPRRQVALPVGTEAADVAERRIPGFVRLHQPHVPVPQIGDARHRRLPHRLPGIAGPDGLFDPLPLPGLLRFLLF